PEGHVEDVPAGQGDRNQQDERLCDREGDDREHGPDDQRRTDRRQPEISHLPEDALVLGDGDLSRVPGAPAPVARPALAVGDLLRLAALTANRYRRRFHPIHCRAKTLLPYGQLSRNHGIESAGREVYPPWHRARRRGPCGRRTHEEVSRWPKL